MSDSLGTQESLARVDAGKVLSACLHEARERKGYVICPACHVIFDATHRIKCPKCRLLLDNSFEEWCAHSSSEGNKKQESGSQKRLARTRQRRSFRKAKTESQTIEFDFFTEGYMEYHG